jgi:hypothetical protein
MPVDRIKCPECGKSINPSAPVEAGKRIRCGGCRAAFLVPEEEDRPRRRSRPAEDDAEDDRPRRRDRDRDRPDEDDDLEREPRRRSKSDRDMPKKKGGLVPLLLIGGGVLALLTCGGCGIGGYFFFGGSGGGLPGFDRAVTQADLDKVQAYDSLEEVQAALGKGRTISSKDPLLEGIQGGSPDSVWYAFGRGGQHVLVAFDKGRSGTLRVVFSVFVKRAEGGNFKSETARIGVLTFRMPNTDVDDAWKANRAAAQALEKTRNDPRWLKGADARKALVGRWTMQKVDTFVFDANGSYRREGLVSKGTGTYRFVADDKIEVTVQTESPFPNQPKPPPETLTYEVRVDDKEVVFFDSRFPKTPMEFKREK